jgi:hypothetical protein
MYEKDKSTYLTPFRIIKTNEAHTGTKFEGMTPKFMDKLFCGLTSFNGYPIKLLSNLSLCTVM